MISEQSYGWGEGGGKEGYKSYLAAPRYINIYKEKKTFHSMHHETKLILLMKDKIEIRQ